MPDISSTVKTIFTADTRDLKRGLRELTDEQKKLAQVQINAAEKQNASLDAAILKWGKIAGAVGAAIAAYKGLSVAAEKYAKHAQLEGAAVGANIGAIQKAAGGLITEYEALRLAAAGMNADHRASQSELEQVAKFMVVLRNQGNDLGVTYQELTKAIVESNAEGLRKFGIQIKEQTGSLAAHEAIMKRIAEENEKAGDNISRAGDSAKRAGVQWQDALDRLVVGLGRVADALAPIVSGLAKVVDVVAYLGPGTRGSGPVYRSLTDQMIYGGLGGSGNRLREIGQRTAHDMLEQEIFSSVGRRLLVHGAPIASVLGRGLRKTVTWNKRSGGGGGGVDYGAFEGEGVVAQPWSLTGGALSGYSLAAVPGATLGQQIQTRKRGDFDWGAFEDRIAGLGGGAGAQSINAFTMALANMRDIGMNAFASVAAAAGDAFASMIDGTEMAGRGFADMMKTILHSMSSQMFGLAITEGVMALVAVAKGIAGVPNAWAEAAAHGKAAAAAAAGGLAVAGLGRALGGGGGGGGGALPGAAAGAVGVGGGSAGSNVTIFVGSDFEENPRGRSQRLLRAFKRARTMEGDDAIVTTD